MFAMLLARRLPPVVLKPCRGMKSQKHYKPEWRKLRSEKVIKTKCPDYELMMRRRHLPPAEARREMKKLGIIPPANHFPPISLTSSKTVFDPLTVDEDAGRLSRLSKKVVSSVMSDRNAAKAIQNELNRGIVVGSPFRVEDFPLTALDIYIKAHLYLEQWDESDEETHHALLDYVTEKAYADMVAGLERKTLRWRFIESVEPPVVARVRKDYGSIDNEYAQITVRLHTRQTLAIYDQFGRLIFGSENLVKLVHEYCVFERFLNRDDIDETSWRLHAKLLAPDQRDANQWLSAAPNTLKLS